MPFPQNFLDELLARSDAWLSTQPFTVEDNTYPTPEQQAKHIRITQGTDKAYTLARQYDVKLAWGTDLLFNPANTRKQNHGIVKALQEQLGHEIHTTPLTQYNGALGAALFAYQKALKNK